LKTYRRIRISILIILFSYQTLTYQNKDQSETAWGWYDLIPYACWQGGQTSTLFSKRSGTVFCWKRGERTGRKPADARIYLKPLLGYHLYSISFKSPTRARGDGDSVYALTINCAFHLIIAWVKLIQPCHEPNHLIAPTKSVWEKWWARKRRSWSSNKIYRSLFGKFFRRACWRWCGETGLAGILLGFLEGQSAWLYRPEDFWLLSECPLGRSLCQFYLPSCCPLLSRAVLKGKVMRTSQGNVLRKSLVVFQFVASVVLITGSIIVYQQLNFMKNQNLGVDITRRSC